MLALPELRLATPAHAAAIARLSRDCIEHGLPWRWSADRVAQAVADPATNVVVACRHDRVQGFGIMEYRDDNAHLALLAVAPLMRHQGLGRQLLAWLERCAQVAGATGIRLECRADNRNALAFYRRLGYRPVGRISGYYEGRIGAVQMEKRGAGTRG